MSKVLKKRRNEFVLLGGAAPVLAIVLVKVFAPIDGPRAASADTLLFDIPAVKTFDAPELNDSQRVLSEAGMPEQDPDAWPFLEAAIEDSDEIVIDEPDDTIGADVEYVQSLSVTSILRGTRPVAVIGGKPRQIDDRLDHGWWISDIDASTFRVTLSHTYHGTVVLQIENIRPE